MSTEHLLLELEELDHQAGKRLVGGGLSLDVLGEQQHKEAVRAEPQRGHIQINCSVSLLLPRAIQILCFIISTIGFKSRSFIINRVFQNLYNVVIPLNPSDLLFQARHGFSQRGAPESTSGSELHYR